MATDSASAPFSMLTGLVDRQLTRTRSFWALQGAGWLAFGVVMFGWALAFWPAGVALVNKVELVALGLLASTAFRHMYRLLRRREWSAPRIGIAVAALSFAAAPLWYAAHKGMFELSCRVIVSVSPQSGMAAGCLLPTTLPWPVPTETWLFYGFVLTTWSLLYFIIDGLSELRSTRARAARADALAVEARLTALQAQLEPHFLFNALNAISTLVTSGRTDAAVSMIDELGGFLRATVGTRDTPEVPLAIELGFVRRYLSVEEYRFGERLRVVLDIDDATLDARVPTLLLQPLVENAVRHGILPKAAGGCIWIRAALRGRVLVLSVEDDGVGIGDDPPSSAGLGLNNTRRRLRELYGDSARLDIGNSTTGGAIVNIALPARCNRSLGSAA